MNRIPKIKLCGLLGITRQKYYRSCWRFENKRKTADQVVSMVDSIRMTQPLLFGRVLLIISSQTYMLCRLC